MTWRLPVHPEWVAVVNAMGANVGTEAALVDLSEESLLATAADATGGLDDTIVQYDPATKKGNGFKFTRYDDKEFLSATKGAISFYSQPVHWKQLLQNAMAADFSWQRSAEAYLQLYRKALEKKRRSLQLAD